MKQIFRLLTIIFVGSNSLSFVLLQPTQQVLGTSKLIIQSSNNMSVAQKINFERHFHKLGVEGSILIYDLNKNKTYEHNPSRNAKSFLPASTFKILNSLIALETGVLNDELSVFTWDGIKRDFPQWNRDLNMREAFKNSAVWFYQVIARRVGHEEMQKWVTKVGYGNQKIGSKEDIDTFWLKGEIRITPQEQIQFLQRLYKNDLPFSERSQSIVKDIAIIEQTPNYTIRAKTGWAARTTPQIGWYVGYLERDNNTYFFTVNIDIRNKKDIAARKELMRRCFQDLKLL
ncbi:class D beta-lactamase [Mastigocoleus testarum]|uniref:Beta-lactamase n=1 Tax=Mastigocoleus testarum BC008 TaxID=371196 RepID=A0A0V7ZWU3_9CYAN|nr:class D beta-lactamase [Mastigocoleus testarum]KST63066.1 class D beta-lactamase [Mastigocoleus testarum BC008]KST69075.1 class D beta-lactamase [Mastigocoleus testarum BC008]